jgi:hypothetical protein
MLRTVYLTCLVCLTWAESVDRGEERGGRVAKSIGYDYTPPVVLFHPRPVIYQFVVPSPWQQGSGVGTTTKQECKCEGKGGSSEEGGLGFRQGGAGAGRFPPRKRPTSGSTTSTMSPPPSTRDISPCVWATVACCSPDNSNIRYQCFEMLKCEGAFWGLNPCEKDVVVSAAQTILNFYSGNSTTSK